MRTFLTYFTLICVFVSLSATSCRDKFYGESLALRNNSNGRIYFWYDSWNRFHLKDFTPQYHYPDTVLPMQIPQGLNKYMYIAPNYTDAVSEADPDWQTIFSKFPAGKLSVYFFPILPETQEQWDSIKINRVYTRKDVTYDELVINKWKIYYP